MNLVFWLFKMEVLNMESKRLGVVESKFADIVWANEPLTSRAFLPVRARK